MHQTIAWANDDPGLSPSGVNRLQWVNTLGLRQKKCPFADNFKFLFLYENCWILLQILLKYVPNVQLKKPTWVQIMAYWVLLQKLFHFEPLWHNIDATVAQHLSKITFVICNHWFKHLHNSLQCLSLPTLCADVYPMSCCHHPDIWKLEYIKFLSGTSSMWRRCSLFSLLSCISTKLLHFWPLGGVQIILEVYFSNF